MAIIKNGRAYPKSLKLAALKASKSKKASVASVAADFNISAGTLATWRNQASIQAAQPVGLAAHRKAAAAIKAYNTPTVVTKVDGSPQHIMFRGVVYK